MMNEEPAVVNDELMMTTQVVNEGENLIATPDVPEDVMTIASIEEPTPISATVQEPAQGKIVTQYVAFILVAVVFVAGVSLFLTARRVKNEKGQ